MCARLGLSCATWTRLGNPGLEHAYGWFEEANRTVKYTVSMAVTMAQAHKRRPVLAHEAYNLCSYCHASTLQLFRVAEARITVETLSIDGGQMNNDKAAFRQRQLLNHLRPVGVIRNLTGFLQ